MSAKKSARSIDPALLYSGILLVLTIIGVSGTYIATSYYGKGGFQEVLLFWVDDRFPGSELPALSWGPHRFGDFLLPWLQTLEGNPYLTDTVFRSNYPPFAHLLVKPFTFLEYKEAFAAYIALGLAFLVYPVWASLGRRTLDAKIIITTATVGLAFPLWVTIDRGNIQLFVVGFALLGALAVVRERWMLAAVLFALPISLKIYPALLLLLFVRERRWRELAFSILVICALSLTSLMTLTGSLYGNLKAFWHNTFYFRGAGSELLVSPIPFFQNGSADSPVGGRYNISPFSLFHWMQLRTDYFGTSLGNVLADNFQVIVLFMLIVCVVIAASLHLSRFEATTLMILPTLFVLESISAYALLLVLVPLVFLFASGRFVTRVEVVTSVLLAILIFPKTIPFDDTGATIANVTYPLIEIAIITVIVSAYLSRRFDFPWVRHRFWKRVINT